MSYVDVINGAVHEASEVLNLDYNQYFSAIYGSYKKKLMFCAFSVERSVRAVRMHFDEIFYALNRCSGGKHNRRIAG